MRQLGFGLFLVLGIFSFAIHIAAQRAKPPVIVIPGLIGSELVNGQTGEVVWFKTIRSRKDDLRLPLSANLSANRDNLIPRDVLRTIKIGLGKEKQAYAALIDGLKSHGGYVETSWDNPKADSAIYVFPYDWRRDNVENARLLVQKIENLKRRLRQPDLKFNVIAHSMGGLIARYAAMYGDADLPTADPRPTWAGGDHFDKIFLLGTPNEGSMLALQAISSGVTPFGININLPFVQNLTKFDFFTIPSIYQLLPPRGAFRAYSEDLQPLAIDIYDPQTWAKYGWNPANDSKFATQFDAADRRAAQSYFLAALSRAEKFQAALSANKIKNAPVLLYRIGGDCADTLNAVVIRRNGQNWTTLFKATAFRDDNGKMINAAELKKLMFARGDGIVTKSSLNDDDANVERQIFRCEAHNTLPNNAAIQADLLRLMQVN